MLNVKIFSFPPTFQNKNGKSFKQIIKYNTVNFIKSFNQNYKQKIEESKSQVEKLYFCRAVFKMLNSSWSKLIWVTGK